MKKICMMIMSLVINLSAFSQTNQTIVEKQLQDSLRKTNAGKADVISSNKKSIFDSTTVTNISKEAVNSKAVKPKSKGKSCGKGNK